MLTLWDRLLAALVLGAAAASLLLIPTATFSDGASSAIVVVDGSVRQEMPLDRANTLRISGNGGFCLAEFKAGDFRIKDSNCPRRLCVRQGWAGGSGQPLICLPHRIVVTGRSAAREASAPDAVVR